MCARCSKAECICRGILPPKPTHVDVKVPVNPNGLATMVFSLSLPRGIGASDERDPSDEILTAISKTLAELGYVSAKRVAIICPTS